MRKNQKISYSTDPELSVTAIHQFHLMNITLSLHENIYVCTSSYRTYIYMYVCYVYV